MTESLRAFHQDLDRIRGDVVRLAAMVTEFISRGTELLLSNDLHGAALLIQDDDLIDDLTLRIEEHCYQLLALQQPVASDLRSLICAIKLVSEIERSGDLMVNVAKAARRVYGFDFDQRIRGLIEQMGEESTRLFKLAIDAYDERDAALAAALDDMDDRLDSLHKDYIGAIFESYEHKAVPLQPAVQLALIGRYYERVGDHAVNIGDRVQFMVTGWLPEHTGQARVRARANMSSGVERSVRSVLSVEQGSGEAESAEPEGGPS